MSDKRELDMARLQGVAVTSQMVKSRLKELILPAKVMHQIGVELYKNDPATAMVLANQLDAMGRTLNTALDELDRLEAGIEVKHVIKH